MKKWLCLWLFMMAALAPAHAQIATLPVVKSTSYEASHVLKSGAGTLWSITINNHSSTANLWVMLFDAASLPSNGAVTPLYCAVVPAAITSPTALDSQVSYQVLGGISFTTGLTVGLSTNTAGCENLTVDTNNDGWFWSQVQ